MKPSWPKKIKLDGIKGTLTDGGNCVFLLLNCDCHDSSGILHFNAVTLIHVNLPNQKLCWVLILPEWSLPWEQRRCRILWPESNSSWRSRIRPVPFRLFPVATNAHLWRCAKTAAAKKNVDQSRIQGILGAKLSRLNHTIFCWWTVRVLKFFGYFLKMKLPKVKQGAVMSGIISWRWRGEHRPWAPLTIGISSPVLITVCHCPLLYIGYIYIGTILCLPIRGIPTSTREMELAHVMYVSLKPWDCRCCAEMADGHYLGCILGICEVRSTLFRFLFSGVEEACSFHFGTKTFGLIVAFMKLSWRQNQNGSPPNNMSVWKHAWSTSGTKIMMIVKETGHI